MTNNKRNAKKQHRETSPVKAAEETPTASVTSPEVPPQTVAPAEPEEQVDPLMAEVEAFLSKRDELAQKIAEEIEATELKLAELKKTAASLFPDSAGGAPSVKPKKPKPKAPAKSESASTTEGESAAE